MCSPATAPPASASTSGRWTRTRPAAAARWSSFKELQSRSTRAEAKKPPDRTEEEAIYVEAWGQCTAAGLKIVDGKLQIDGKDATGLEVEDALAGPMATGGLRKYQVIQIAEELEELWAKPLAPGMFGSQMIGNKYAASSDFGTKDATFPTDKYTIKLSAPAKVATIGEAVPTSGSSWRWRTSSRIARIGWARSCGAA